MVRTAAFYFKEAIDIFIVYYIIYRLILILKGTKALHILGGVFLLAFITFLSKLAGLDATFWLLQQFWLAGIFLLIVVFQPEIRNTLANLGTNPLGRIIVPSEFRFISEVMDAVRVAMTEKMGMLIVLEQDMGLREYIESGVVLNAEVSKELLLTVFHHNTPLHDGAVIISGSRLIAAACQLPLTERQDMSKILGMRHRSAVGITEITDSIAIVVSEETGNLSVARNGSLMMKANCDDIEKELISLYKSKAQKTVFRKTNRV
ncbi:MAG: TIGR00159 family protein [Elusimicrobia bacterium]|nr:TIGR00159 family protein [Elusimicrobiota bacterium]